MHDTWLWLRQEAAVGRPLSEIAHRPEIGLDPGKEQEILASFG